MDINFKWIILENILLILFLFSLFFLYIRRKKINFSLSKEQLSDSVSSPTTLERDTVPLEKINELREENIILKTELEEVNSDLLNMKEEITNLKDENEKLNTLLDTVSSLLNGKKTEKLKDMDKIEQAENFLFKEFIRKIDALNLFDNEYEVFESLRKAFEQWKITQVREWDNGKINVALIGKFSSGKSSIINSLIGSSLLPVDTNPTTAIPTFVSHGYSDSVYYEDKEGIIREIDIMIFKNISYVTLKNFPISFFIKYFVIFSDLSSIKDINILDTPGFSSNNESDKNRMIESIEYVDVIFYVVDINDGTLSNDVLDTLSEIKNKDELKNKPIYIVINKSDTKPPSEREKIKNHIINVLEEKQIQYDNVLLYSTKKNIDNCHETLKDIIKLIKKEKEELNVFDSMISLCEECIKKLKERYDFRLPADEARTIENQIILLNELLKQTKILKGEVML